MIDKLKTLYNNYLGNNMGSMINALSILNDKYFNLDSNFVRNMKSDITRLSQFFSEYLEKKENILLLDLKEKFPNTYRLANDDINKFSLLLRKGIHPYEYMDSWEKFEETELPLKKGFYSELNFEDITDEKYEHAHNAWNTFNIKDLGEYHDL